MKGSHTRKKFPLGKIPLDQITRCHPTSKKKDRCLPSEIYDALGPTPYKTTGCEQGADHCLLDKINTMSSDQKKTLRKRYLRPKRPTAWDDKPNTWLDNFNILNTMKQYEKSVPWFRFIGVFPRDFSAPNPYKKDRQECLHQELCSLQLKDEYAKGVRGIGIVFNLDFHFNGGSHWVAMYINLWNIKEPIISYFDSYGYKTPDLIARLMKSFPLQIKTCKLGFNARRFQYGGSECGMFSMYFIICMISGISFKDFCKTSVNDSTMLELRKILFSK